MSEDKEFNEMIDEICSGMSPEEKEFLKRKFEDIITDFVSNGESELDLIRLAKEICIKTERIVMSLRKD